MDTERSPHPRNDNPMKETNTTPPPSPSPLAPASAVVEEKGGEHITEGHWKHAAEDAWKENDELRQKLVGCVEALEKITQLETPRLWNGFEWQGASSIAREVLKLLTSASAESKEGI